MKRMTAVFGMLAIAAFVSASIPAQAKTFKFAFQGDVASMDPYALAENFSNAFHSNIHDSLIRYDENLQIEPALAVSWEVVDPKTWRFKLREGVKFHNGNTFEADDVVFSIKRSLKRQVLGSTTSQQGTSRHLRTSTRSSSGATITLAQVPLTRNRADMADRGRGLSLYQ